MATTKKRQVTFTGRVSYGFKHDTAGYEASKDANGKALTTSREFEPGETFLVPDGEHDEFDKLAAAGLVTEGASAPADASDEA